MCVSVCVFVWGVFVFDVSEVSAWLNVLLTLLI